MKAYARTQAAVLLRRLAFQVSQALRRLDADAIHDLLFAMRRFSNCLRVFAPFFPARAVKKIRRQLTATMDLSTAVRDRDIACGLLRSVGIEETAAVAARWRRERAVAGRDLVHALQVWQGRDFSRRWRRRLEL